MLSVSYDGPVALTEFNSIFNVMCKRYVLPYQYHNHKDGVVISQLVDSAGLSTLLTLHN